MACASSIRCELAWLDFRLLLIKLQLELQNNPNWREQPRAPAGTPEGGQWVTIIDDGSGRKPQVIYDPPAQPVYLLETLLGGLSAREALAAARAVAGLVRRAGQHLRIRSAAESIERYLGGPAKNVIRNRNGDVILMRDDKQVRFDINYPHPHPEPHFHIERSIPDGRGDVDWIDAGNRHWYPFAKGAVK